MNLTYLNKKDVFQEHIADLGNGIQLPYLTFHLLDQIPGYRHCFTTRHGGVSSGIFSSLNLSYTRGDDRNCVDENYRRVACAMGTDTSHIVTSDQTHTTNIRIVTSQDAGKGVTCPRDYTDIDGLITDEPGLLLAAFYADCVPLYFIDPVHRAIGLSHSGWRGTISRMGARTIEAMGKAFGSRPEDIYAAVGPSICQDCYQVSRSLGEKFSNEFPAAGEELVREDGEEHARLNLWLANRIVMTDAGILPEHMAVTNLCTCHNPCDLFSHRASHGRRGNLGAFLMIEE